MRARRNGGDVARREGGAREPRRKAEEVVKNKQAQGSKDGQVVRVVFLAPRGDDELEVDVGRQTTGQQAVEGLVDAQFIAAPGADVRYSLQLVRTKASLPLSGALVASGVQDGDRVAVVLVQAGASWRA